VRRQALELSPSRFDADLGRLLRVLKKTLAETQALDPAAAAPPAVEPIAHGPAATPGAVASPGPSSDGTARTNPIRRLLSTRARIAAAAVVLVLLLVGVVRLATGDKPPSSGDGSDDSTEEPAPSDDSAPSDEGAWSVTTPLPPGLTVALVRGTSPNQSDEDRSRAIAQ